MLLSRLLGGAKRPQDNVKMAPNLSPFYLLDTSSTQDSKSTQFKRPSGQLWALPAVEQQLLHLGADCNQGGALQALIWSTGVKD